MDHFARGGKVTNTTLPPRQRLKSAQIVDAYLQPSFASNNVASLDGTEFYQWTVQRSRLLRAMCRLLWAPPTGDTLVEGINYPSAKENEISADEIGHRFNLWKIILIRWIPSLLPGRTRAGVD